MNSRSLALRDMPRAALLGILAPAMAAGAVSGESDFGAEDNGYQPQFSGDLAGGSYNAAFGHSGTFSPAFGSGHAGFGVHGYQARFGADPGAGSMVPASGPAPSPQALMQAWHQQQGMQAKTNERLSLLSPNNGSHVDVEAYVFSLNPTVFTTGTTLTWGIANGWTAFKNPQTSFRAEILKVNVNQPGVCYLQNIQTANVNAQIGAIADAYTFTALANGSRVSLPTLPPQNTLQVNGTWTNVVPVPFTTSQTFQLALDFMGWATVTA
jgi:hypothetical protein